MSSKSGISEKLQGIRDKIEKLKIELEQAKKELHYTEIDAVIEAERDPKRIAEIYAKIEARNKADEELEKETRKKNKAVLKKYIEDYNAGKIPIKTQGIIHQPRDDSMFGGRTSKKRSNRRKSMKRNK